ncbi:MAG TPA: hypothetical protein VHN20_08455 [Beijerinckiaceae bacterium]|nr:hypothetical protein [Beijerinckiaceae bacterium]
MQKRDWAAALSIVWILVSLVIACVLLAPAVFKASAIQHIAPVCTAKARGGACAFCGMTTAFLHISSGRFGDAVDANAGSLWLYTAMAANEILLLLFIRPILQGVRLCRSSP